MGAAKGMELPTVTFTESEGESLVDEYHRLHKCLKSHSLTERERYKQVQEQLDSLNKEEILPVKEPFDREEGMKEYLVLKEKFLQGDHSVEDRFITLQNKLF